MTARPPDAAGGPWEIRPFATLAEFRACVTLQEEVWGAGFSERVPVAILKVAQRLGGIASGAWDADGELVGFVFGLTGIRRGEPVHWSDMLAVRPGLRDAGLGTRLKAYQREFLLDAGVRTVLWTFDPLESRNAYLNLEHLGVVAREYEVDMYGDSGSPLHQGLGTDRLIALWELDSPRVAARMESSSAEASPEEGSSEGGSSEEGTPAEAASGAPAALEALVDDGEGGPPGEVGHSDHASLPRPATAELGLTAPVLSVAIPADIQALKERDPGLARAWRRQVRAALTHYLERGWEARALRRAGTVSRYLLVRRG